MQATCTTRSDYTNMKFERTRAYTRHQRQRTMRRKMIIVKHA
ncbi:rod shape-determining protein MreB [Bacillus toyonensis]|uniref:Rod shape-determining protein MreB n=1 Tax=Bacillus toyonensis TaxID=155322 RepID=A0A2B4Y326_9BACI|nr:rod shape-determining protein MreB [Bacillus sp. COPE52]EEL59327.1 hypothetical protein bcere0024_013370 [Bacillus cereus Rock4-18]MBJ7928038.1 rod shape-determining protein MreB [Bacillus cereus group sp. N31]MBJ8075383.1 rod shape-determining protein MreB [Bacillus cereus group sp. N12]MBJ8099587.1 rod shape-determining protein MreB [Bacillus cereus group sp. N11]MBX0353104.1 rod shape-determining protein MreB [Bacillus toyonensis]OTX31570.1 rod shape-determining protein MreB [Bacillus t